MKAKKPTILNIGSRATVSKITRFIKDGDHVLDLGAGKCLKGWYLKKRRKIKLTSLDIYRDKKALLPVILYDGQNVPFEGNSFDVVLLLGVLHHVKVGEREKIIKEARRVSKGLVVILEDTPENKRERFFNRIWDRIFNLPNRGARFFPYFSQRKWEACFRRVGMQLQHKEKVKSPWSWLNQYTRALYVLRK